MNRSIFDVFHEIFNDYERFCNDEYLGKFFNLKEEKKDSDDKERDYQFFKTDKYVDGKHVYHKEKEIVDGKVIKDECFNNRIEDKKKEDDELIFDIETETNDGEPENELEIKVKDLKETCDGLVEDNKKLEEKNLLLEKENFELKEKLDNIKKFLK